MGDKQPESIFSLFEETDIKEDEVKTDSIFAPENIFEEFIDEDTSEPEENTSIFKEESIFESEELFFDNEEDDDEDIDWLEDEEEEFFEEEDEEETDEEWAIPFSYPFEDEDSTNNIFKSENIFEEKSLNNIFAEQTDDIFTDSIEQQETCSNKLNSSSIFCGESSNIFEQKNDDINSLTELMNLLMKHLIG